MIGTTVGKYRIVGVLGRGGMGTVYKAVDETLGREVAVKVLNADLLAPDRVARFKAEAVTLARLSHPHIAHVYELASSGESLLMVMECIQGETLEQLVARHGPLPIDRAVRIVAQVLDGLQHAHRAGIVHRDLKPANLMVTASGDVKVMDFGIARVQGATRLTGEGYMLGTPAYMAPEQVRGDEVDARTDLYAMGVVLYQLVTGRLPFEADTTVAMIQKQLNEPPTPARQHRSDLPPWLDDVLARALAKSPAERFQSSEDLRLALLRYQHPDQFTPTLPLTPGPQAVPAVAPEAQVAAAVVGSQSTVTLQRRHLAMGATAGVALAVVGGAAMAYLVLRGGDPEPARTPQTAATSADVQTPSPIAAASPATQSNPLPLRETPPSQAPSAPPVAAPAPPTGAAVLPARPAPINPRPTVPDTASREAPATPAAPVPAVPVIPASPRPALPPERAPVEFDDVKIVVPEEGRTREYDVRLKVGDGRIWAISAKSPAASKSMPYGRVVSITYSQSRHPRWKEGIGVAVVAGVFSAPVFFMKSTRHWLTVQARDDYFVLHLDKDNARSIVQEIETRAGVEVQQLQGDK